MEAISTIVTSLAVGAAAVAGKEAVSGLVKDAYSELKSWIKSHYSDAGTSLDQLEAAPQSKAQRVAVEKELSSTSASQDEQLFKLALRVSDLILKDAPSAIGSAGIIFEDFRAANIRIRDVISSGPQRYKNLITDGDIELGGLRAGGNDSKKN